MKKSEVFNRRFPTPMDHHVLPLYKNFLLVQKEIVNQWRQEVVSHLIGYRNFADLNDCRLHIQGKPNQERSVVLSLKPVIGKEVEELLFFNVRFFETYRTLQNNLIKLIWQGLSFAKNPELKKEWRKNNNREVHSLIVLIDVLVNAMFSNTLEEKHLDLFLNKKDVSVLDTMIRSLDLPFLIFSDTFNNGGHFYEDIEGDKVNAWWNYVKKDIVRWTAGSW